MPYDSHAEDASAGDGARRPQNDQAISQRGALRPPTLTSARARLNGKAVSLWVRLTDLVAVMGMAAISAGADRFGRPGLLVLGAALFAILMLHAFETYRFQAKEQLAPHLYRVLGAMGASTLATMAVARLLFPSAEIDTTIVTWAMQVSLIAFASHLGWFLLIRRLRRSGLLTPNLVIVGATPAAEQLIRTALATREAHILGVFDDRKSRAPRNLFGVPLLGSTASLTSHRILPFVDRVIIAVPSEASARIADLLNRLAPIPNPISLLLDPVDKDSAMSRETQDSLLDMPLAHLSGVRFGWAGAIIKRVTDLVVGAFALLVLAPLLAAIAVAIALDSPGPVFFRQRRHGYLNEEVVVWKFRTMRVEMQDDTAKRQVSADDDRITRVGRFLRRTSLDELPQLINVIRGEMSLVGPRPHAIGMLAGGEDASRLMATYAYRHRIKPGLTGWAAVNGSRGPADSAEAIRRRVAYDLEYIERQSFWFDLSIMLRTLPCLLGDKSAVR